MRPVCEPECDPVGVVQSSRAGHVMASGRGEKDERRDAMTIHLVSLRRRGLFDEADQCNDVWLLRGEGISIFRSQMSSSSGIFDFYFSPSSYFNQSMNLCSMKDMSWTFLSLFRS